MLYIDTSVLVAALTNESRTAEMQNWLASQRPEDLVISDWVMTEFSAALSVKVRTGQLTPPHQRLGNNDAALGDHHCDLPERNGRYRDTVPEAATSSSWNRPRFKRLGRSP